MGTTHCILMTLVLLLLVIPVHAIEIEITDSEFTLLNSIHSPTTAVLDASGSSVQSNPSHQSYLVDTEYNVADATTAVPTTAVLDASSSPAQSNPSLQSYLVDTEYNVADATTAVPTNAVLDASGSPAQSNPSLQSYLVDTEYNVADATTFVPTTAVLDASSSPAQSNPSLQSYLVDTEYNVADATTAVPTTAVLDASGSPVQSDPSLQSYLIDTEYSAADVTTTTPTTTVLDASGSTIQSDPSLRSYIIDHKFTITDNLQLKPWGESGNNFYYYPTTAFPNQETELTVIVNLTEISMNVGDSVQWNIMTPTGNMVIGESDTLKCCLAGGLYDKAYYDFPEYGTYTIKAEFLGYTEYVEWTVEVWGPTGEINGIVTNPTDIPLENVDIYLYNAKDKYEVLNFIDEWRNDPTASVPPYISSSITNNTGNYQLIEIIPGSYLVLAVPQITMDYLPKTSDVHPIEKDEIEIINLHLELKVRWLAELDKEMETIKDLSKVTVDDNTRASAEVYVDGYETFYDVTNKNRTILLSNTLSAINYVMSVTDPTATIGTVKLATKGVLVNDIVVPITEHGIDLALANHWWNVRNTPFQDKLNYYSSQVNSLTWMKEFSPNTVGTLDDALQNGYYTTSIYKNSLSSIDDSFENYNKTIVYNTIPSDFSIPESENVLQNQVIWLQDKSHEDTKIADGIIITPIGNVYLFKTTQAHRDDYYNAKFEMEVAETGQAISEVTSTAGHFISHKGAYAASPHAIGVGLTVQIIGWAGEIAFNTYEIYAKNKMAKQWGYTQIYWIQDLDVIPKINQEIVDWLDNETKDPRLPYINGRIVDTDLNLIQLPFSNKNIAFANEPNYPWWWILPKMRWWILNTNTVTIESTSSIDNVKTRILCIDRYGNEIVSEMPTIYPNYTMPPMSMKSGETKTIDLPYSGDFQLFDPFHWHYLSTILWMEGKQPDIETDIYYVIPIPFSPLPYCISNKTIISTQEVDTFIKQPIKSEKYAFTAFESNNAISLEDWGNLIGNATKIIDTNLDSVNDSTQILYMSNASITDITFLMTTIPGSHLNLHVYDELGRHVGYFTATDSDQVQIPNATYTGNLSNPEIIFIPYAAGKNYTIKVDATQFTSSSPIPVEVYAIETPIRPAVLGISPVELYPFMSPGETKNITMQIAEVGQQVDIENIVVIPHGFIDKYGNTLPEVTISLSQNNFDIGAGNTTDLVITLNVPDNIILPDIPETRYEGNITIQTSNAGTINATLHLLILNTNLHNMKLINSEPNITGIHISSLDISEINETYKPEGTLPESAYTINSTGTGNFTILFAEISNANNITAYKINNTNHWIPLNTITTADNVTITMSVEDTHIVFASTERIIQLNSGWNLISLPLMPDDSNVNLVLSPISGNYSIVCAYNASDTDDHWKKYDPTTPFGNDLTTMEPGNGYWIMMTSDDTLNISRTMPAPTDIELWSGWNLIGYNSLNPQTITDALSSIDGNYSIIWAYSASDSTDYWKKYDPDIPFGNDLANMEPGNGYWIMMTTDDILEI